MIFLQIVDQLLHFILAVASRLLIAVIQIFRQLNHDKLMFFSRSIQSHDRLAVVAEPEKKSQMIIWSSLTEVISFISSRTGFG